MKNVDVIIPWKPGCFYRYANLQFIVNWWKKFDITPILGELDEDAPWVKALAVANGLERSDAEVIVITDGDLYVPTVMTAVQQCLDGDAWSMPQREVARLSAASTSDLLRGLGEHGYILDRNRYRSTVGGGLLVLRREVYDDVPLDPRFVGWGQEDESWGLALETFHEGRRGLDDLWHLWHPPAPRKNRQIGSRESLALRNRYGHARNKPEVMRALLDEV